MWVLGIIECVDRINRETLWQVLRMYEMDGKMMSGITSMYVDWLACVRVKAGERECFRIDRGVRQGCIMSPWLFNLYMDTKMKKVKMGSGRRGMRFLEDGREWRLPGLSHADNFVLCCKLEKDILLRCVEEA